MSDWTIPGGAGVLAVAIIGVGEGITWIITPVVVIGVLAVAAFLLRSGQTRTTRTVRVHVHGKDWNDAARHEAGHAAVMRKVGARRIHGEIRPDGTGYVQAQVPCSTPFEREIAISLAGGIREGVNPWTARQCSGDRANIERTLAHVPAGERAGVKRAAERYARHTEFFGHGIRSSYAASVEAQLKRTGRL